MKLLIIDDDEEFTDVLIDRIQRAGVSPTIVIARSRASALAVVAGATDFDLIVCDLKMPSVDGALDPDIAHGKATFLDLRERLPGTPVIVASAFAEAPDVGAIAAASPHVDPFGSGENVQIGEYVPKSPDLEECVTKIQWAAAELEQLMLVSLSPIPEDLTLTPSHARLLRAFARRRGARVVKFSEFPGGLSSSRVLKVRCEGEDGSLKMVGAAKLSSKSEIDDEGRRYNAHMVVLPGGFAHLIGVQVAGAGADGAAFYMLDERFDRSLLDVLSADPDQAAIVVANLRQATARWRAGRPVQRLTVGDIRQMFIGDELLAVHGIDELLAPLDRISLERHEIQARPCPQHCDLHGENVRVDSNGEPQMIDFGSCDMAVSAVDPVTLELSVLFHPAAAAVLAGVMPSPDVAGHWADRTTYLDGCPSAPYVGACRDWAVLEGASNEELYATAYGYAVRQLRFPGTDQALAAQIAASCAHKLMS